MAYILAMVNINALFYMQFIGGLTQPRPEYGIHFLLRKVQISPLIYSDK